MIGSVVGGRYRVERQIGAGGMGSVYEASHVGTGRRVALKLVLAELAKQPVAFGRFQREAKAAGSLETDHIVQILDAGVDESTNLPYMVMEYLEGEDVQQLAKRLGPMPPTLALRIVAQCCLALAKAHAAGIVHRDVKPANLFVAKRDGGARVVKLLDFGVAKVRVEQEPTGETTGLTRTGSLIGSPLYMSPEQARGIKQIDRRTDLWSLGVVLYSLLAGRAPTHGIEALGELVLSICSESPPAVQSVAPWVEPEVARVVARAMKISVSQRYQTAEEMLQAIKALLPQGIALDDSMLQRLSFEQKAKRAPLFVPADGEADNQPPPRASFPAIDVAIESTLVPSDAPTLMKAPSQHLSTTAPVSSDCETLVQPTRASGQPSAIPAPQTVDVDFSLGGLLPDAPAAALPGPRPGISVDKSPAPLRGDLGATGEEDAPTRLVDGGRLPAMWRPLPVQTVNDPRAESLPAPKGWGAWVVPAVLVAGVALAGAGYVGARLLTAPTDAPASSLGAEPAPSALVPASPAHAVGMPPTALPSSTASATVTASAVPPKPPRGAP